MKKEKPSIILVHGFRGTHHGLSLIARELNKNYKCLIPDIPGFGNGPKLNSYSIEEYVKWLESYINSHKFNKKPFLVGHSFGSIITSAYAAKHPEKIEKLILINPIGEPALKSDKIFMTKLSVAYYRIGSILPEKLSKTWLSLPPIVLLMSIFLTKTNKKPLRKYIHNQHLKYFSRFSSTKAVLLAFQTSITNSVQDNATDIKVPCLLIAGELDDITNIDKQKYLANKIKNSKLIIIKGTGHLTHYETPEEVSRHIVDWIN